MKRVRVLGISSWVWAFALGCSGRAIEVGPPEATHGSESVGGAASSDSGEAATLPPSPAWPEPTACVPESDLPGLVGTWKGYIENQDAPWDDLTLVVLGASATEGLCGTLTLGEGVPPAIGDPNAGYPPDESYTRPEVVPGYALTLLKGATDGTRLRFSINLQQAWKDWCSLQSSYRYDSAPGMYACYPSGALSGELIDGRCQASVDGVRLGKTCNNTELCGASCQCNAAGCGGVEPDVSARWAETETLIGFDLRAAADEATGSNTRKAAYRAIFEKLL